MMLNKISFYLLIQISKYFLLILFIFLSIAWLLQITRLFTITNFMQIDFIDIFLLSFYLLPNIITVILPFILIFGLLLCFIKLNKDNELVSILSLGLGLKPFRNSLYVFTIIIVTIFSYLNFYLAPKIYDQYNKKEYELRNTIDFNNISFSNFLNLNKTTILDFQREGNNYEDILINFKDQKENIIYAKKGNILSENNEYKFQLNDGFKISINNNKELENLEFKNYVLKVKNKKIGNTKTIDQNTFTIFDDLITKNYLNLSFKFLNIFFIIYIIFIFYNNNIKQINFKTINNIYFSLLFISVLIINQILKNSEILLNNYIVTISFVIIISYLISIIKKKYE